MKTQKHTSMVLAASRTSLWQSRNISLSPGLTGLFGPVLSALSLLSADGAHKEEEKQTGLNREKEEEKDELPEARDSKRALQFESELKNVIWVWNVSVKEERKKEGS